MGQQLTMTPQLQQAIRLLQMSTLELQTEIQNALESNVMLETEEDSHDPLEREELSIQSEPVYLETTAESSSLNELAGSHGEEYSDEGMSTLLTDIPDEFPTDNSWNDLYDYDGNTTWSQPDWEDDNHYEMATKGGASLQAHLLDQLRLAGFDSEEEVFALAILDALNEDGLLSIPLEEICSSLQEITSIDIGKAEAVLQRIQQCDPVGVAARNLQECLLLQLAALEEQENLLHVSQYGINQAKRLIQEHLPLLASHDYAKLRRQMKLTEDDLSEIVEVIKGLNPRPGSTFSSQAIDYVVPDVYVRKKNGTWLVELNPDIVPKLRVNNFYASLVGKAKDERDHSTLKNHLQEARWLIRSLQSRNETMLKVCRSIVERQKNFLEYGEEAMKPLVLRDIAEAVAMHESTVSRVTTQKYMHTPRGIFEFKYFFSNQVGENNGDCSATAIRARIKKLIASENPQKPLSDEKIADILCMESIEIARRTVAKYREAMSIPPSKARKRPG